MTPDEIFALHYVTEMYAQTIRIVYSEVGTAVALTTHNDKQLAQETLRLARGVVARLQQEQAGKDGK